MNPKKSAGKLGRDAKKVGPWVPLVPLQAGHEQIFTALGALGIPADECERRSGAGSAFLSKAKRGLREGPNSEKSWRLLAQLAGVKYGPALPTKEAPPVTAAFTQAITAADRLTDLDKLAKQVASELASGALDATTARALLSVIKERRALLVEIGKENASARVGEPLRIVVEFTQDWRAGVEMEDA